MILFVWISEEANHIYCNQFLVCLIFGLKINCLELWQNSRQSAGKKTINLVGPIYLVGPKCNKNILNIMYIGTCKKL